MVAAADLRLAEAGVPNSTKTCGYLTKRSIAASSSRIPRRAEKGAASAQLRTAGRRMRHPKSHNAKSGQGHILDMVSIRERPAEIEDRAVPGHWEGDLLTNDTHIATLVERNTRFTMLVKIPRKRHDDRCRCACQAHISGKLPGGYATPLTWDQGKEMHAHKRFTVATNVQVYFCDPRSPRQRRLKREHQRPAAAVPPERNRISRASPAVILTRLLCGSINVPRKTFGLPNARADRLQAVLH